MVKPLSTNSACKTILQPSWTVSPQREQMTTPSNKKKETLVQQQLVLLLHANICQKRDEITPQREKCQLPHCRGMKNILRHMVNCNIGRNCSFAHCASSKQIILHFKHCANSTCPICKPVRRLIGAQNNSEVTLSTNQSQIIAPTSTPELGVSEPSTSRTEILPGQQIDQTTDDLSNQNASEPASPSSTDNSAIRETLDSANQRDVEMSPTVVHPSPNTNAIGETLGPANQRDVEMSPTVVHPSPNTNAIGGTLGSANQRDVEMSPTDVHPSPNTNAIEETLGAANQRNVEMSPTVVHPSQSSNCVTSENSLHEVPQQQSQQSPNLQPDVEVAQQQTINEPDFEALGPLFNVNIEQTPLLDAINVMPTTVQLVVTKEWHKAISIQHREKLIRTMACKTLPVTWTEHLRLQSILSFLKLLALEESKIYTTADSFVEYGRKFVERCGEIRRDIVEKYRMYREQRQQLLQQPQTSQAGVEPTPQQPQTTQPNVESTPHQTQTTQPSVESIPQQPQTSQSNIEPVQQNPLPNESDVEMPEQNQPKDPAVQPVNSNSNVNVPDNQIPEPIPGPSGLNNNTVPSVNDTLTDEQQTPSKEWHNDIGSEFREILINEFVRKILTVCGSEVKVNNLEESQTTIDDVLKSYVKKSENDFYQKANSRMEYYDLLAEKYFKIQCELRKGNLAALKT